MFDDDGLVNLTTSRCESPHARESLRVCNDLSDQAPLPSSSRVGFLAGLIGASVHTQLVLSLKPRQHTHLCTCIQLQIGSQLATR